VIAGPRFAADAIAELESVVTHYETLESELGSRLMEDFGEALSTILEFPDAFQVIDSSPVGVKVRSVKLRTFPIKVVSTVEKGTLVVVAVFHLHREPSYWLDRLRRM
jgi:hypothetical protein